MSPFVFSFKSLRYASSFCVPSCKPGQSQTVTSTLCFLKVCCFTSSVSGSSPSPSLNGRVFPPMKPFNSVDFPAPVFPVTTILSDLCKASHSLNALASSSPCAPIPESLSGCMIGSWRSPEASTDSICASNLLAILGASSWVGMVRSEGRGWKHNYTVPRIPKVRVRIAHVTYQ